MVTFVTAIFQRLLSITEKLLVYKHQIKTVLLDKFQRCVDELMHESLI